MKRRTRRVALDIIRLVARLPRNPVADVIGRQLAKAGTSVGANYRASCRARSQIEFIAKLGIVEEECDEAIYWLELLVEGEIVRLEDVQSLIKEANEILSMTVA